MKKVLLSLVVMLFTVAAIAQQKQPAQVAATGPQINFEVSEYNFGDIHQGDKVERTFVFTNSGTAPLVLSNVMTTCGCTAPSWPREPIAPGQSAEIKVVFNSAGKMGAQNKTITVLSNAVNGNEKVRIIGNVLPPKKDTDGTR